MVRVVTVDAEVTNPMAGGVMAQEITTQAGQQMYALTQPGFANWQAAPLTPGHTYQAPPITPGVEAAQPRDSQWRLDQRAIGERRAQQDRQRVELQAQIEEKRQRKKRKVEPPKEAAAGEGGGEETQPATGAAASATATAPPPWKGTGKGITLVDGSFLTATDNKETGSTAAGAQDIREVVRSDPELSALIEEAKKQAEL